jgi:hypothetical protein
MYDRKPGHEGNADLHQGHAGATRDREYQRNQEDESDLEEHRNADDERDEHDGPMHAPLAEPRDERGRDARRSAGLRHHLAEHRPEPDDDGDESENAADAILKGLHDAA